MRLCERNPRLASPLVFIPLQGAAFPRNPLREEPSPAPRVLLLTLSDLHSFEKPTKRPKRRKPPKTLPKSIPVVDPFEQVNAEARDFYRQELPSQPDELLAFLEKRPGRLKGDPNLIAVVEERLPEEYREKFESLRRRADDLVAKQRQAQQAAAAKAAKQKQQQRAARLPPDPRLLRRA